MKLLIFGATGTVGKQLILQSVAMGHEVTAFARYTEKLNDFGHKNLNIFKGDVLDASAVEKAVKGHDAVFCTLGAGRKGDVRAKGTLNIIRAMEKTGVKRFICQSTLGVGDSKGNLNFFWKYFMFGFFLKEAYRDHELQEKYIAQSNLDWTIVRPGAFTGGNISGNYKHGFSPTEKKLELKISRSDVALFMLMQLTSGEYIRKTPGLSY
ncbi:MAG: SDR family oxidoreductase [Bacteroidota bacterium]